MLDLDASVEPGTAGHFGFFVDRGSIFVTDLKLERLGPVQNARVYR